MGSRSPYVSDMALESTGNLSTCHHCHRDTRVYPVQGAIIDPALAHDAELARTEPDVDEVCIVCTLTGNIRKYDVDDMAGIAHLHATDPETAMDAWQRTPGVIEFAQRADWPICCGGWAEFTGSPGSDEACIATPLTHRYWERCPMDWHNRYQLLPESHSDISLFRCPDCQARWFIFQFS